MLFTLYSLAKEQTKDGVLKLETILLVWALSLCLKIKLNYGKTIPRVKDLQNQPYLAKVLGKLELSTTSQHTFTYKFWSLKLQQQFYSSNKASIKQIKNTLVVKSINTKKWLTKSKFTKCKQFFILIYHR